MEPSRLQRILEHRTGAGPLEGPGVERYVLTFRAPGRERVAKVQFTPNLRRHLDAPAIEVPGTTVRGVLDAVFETNALLRGYIVDDQGALRKHVSIFVDGRAIADRTDLSDPVDEASEVYVLQALSGG